MWTNWRCWILMNLLLLAAIESIDVPNADCDMFGSIGALLNLPNTVVSELWTRKMRTYVRRMDFDGDGVVTKTDFENMAARFADLEGFDPVEKEAAINCFRVMFSYFTKASATKDDPVMTGDVLIESLNMQRNDPEFKEAMGEIYNSFLTPENVEQEGYISYPEYLRKFQNLGFRDVVFTSAGFALIDSDHDGKISFAQLIDAIIDYMTSDKPGSTALFGLLF